MHDMTLGRPVDIGSYDGPMLEGKPLHGGNCEDGVYGCRMCNSAAHHLTPEQLKAIGWPENQSCDMCHREVSISDLQGLRPWDEPSCFYEVCSVCKNKHNKEVEELIAEDADRNSDYAFEDADFANDDDE